jgi:hypothetical protein
MSSPDSRDPNDQPDLASHLHDLQPTASDDGARSPKNAMLTPRSMQDMEQSLVERIADIDDERRRTSTQLRKALQTHIDDVEARLSVARRAMAALSLVVLLLAAGIIWLGINLQAQRTQLALEISAQQASPSASAGKDQPSDALDDAPDDAPDDALAARLAQIERQLTSLASLAATAQSAPTSDSGIDAESESGAHGSPDQDAETAADLNPAAPPAVIEESQPAPPHDAASATQASQTRAAPPLPTLTGRRRAHWMICKPNRNGCKRRSPAHVTNKPASTNPSGCQSMNSSTINSIGWNASISVWHDR